MKFDRNFNRDIANGREAEENINWLKKLTLNKWSLTFAVILVMLSAYLGLEEVDKQQQLQQQQADEVLYVLDTLPYDIQKVNADGDLAVLGEDGQPPAGQQSQPGTDDKKETNASAEPEQKPEGEPGQQPGVQAGSDNFSINSFQFPVSQNPVAINSDSDFFINYRLEREKARSRQLELLQALIDDEKTTAEMRAEAQSKVIAQAESIEQELMLESILVAKYSGEAGVFIQPEKVNVVLGAEQKELADNEAEKIARLVDNYTGIGYENVIIVLKD